MHWMCCARIRASQHSCARSAAGCVFRGENAALSAGARVEHRYLPRASTRRSDAQQEARGTGPISCVSNAAGRGIRVLDGAATSCEAVAGLQDGLPCLSPGACQNGKTSGEHGTG